MLGFLHHADIFINKARNDVIQYSIMCYESRQEFWCMSRKVLATMANRSKARMRRGCLEAIIFGNTKYLIKMLLHSSQEKKWRMKKDVSP